VKRTPLVISLVVLAAISVPAFASGPLGARVPCMPGVMPGYYPGMRPLEAGPYLAAEIQRVGEEQGAQKIGDMDLHGLLDLRDRLSVASQKDDFVRSTGIHSFLLPGLGQLETGNTGAGIGFMTADLATLAGTLATAYYLLPADLRFDRLDYFRSDISAINTAWQGHTLTDYLPAAAAMLVGMTLDQTLRHWSAAAARRDAVRAIDAGTVTFTPKVGLGVLGFQVAY